MIRNLCYLLLSIKFILIACSSPTDPMKKGVYTIPQNSQLKIYNGSSRTIYTFVVERETAAIIDWSAGFNSPGILEGEFKFIKYTEIWNRIDKRPVKSGDEVIVYYWDDSDRSNPKVYNRVVKL